MSIATVPLLGSAVFLGSIPSVDFALGVVIPLHCHIGFDAIIQDYLPARRAPTLNSIAKWTLRGATLLTLYGCYEFNTNDVGLTALVKRVWVNDSK